MHSIADRASRVLADITRHASGRPITLVAVSKTVGPEAIRAAYGAGLRDFGENRLDGLDAKIEALSDLPDLRWHFIGHLQRNKVRKVVGRVSLIHSVDSLRLLRAVDEEARRQERVQDVLLQFNTSEEESKHGFAAADLHGLVEAMPGCTHLRVRGLMTMAPFVDDEATLRRCFSALRELASELGDHIDGHDLSMGMSNDYQFALDEGATMLRIGTALFGRAR